MAVRDRLTGDVLIRATRSFPVTPSNETPSTNERNAFAPSIDHGGVFRTAIISSTVVKLYIIYNVVLALTA